MQNFETPKEQPNISSMQSVMHSSSVNMEIQKKLSQNQEEAQADTVGFAKKFHVHFDSIQSNDQTEENLTNDQ